MVEALEGFPEGVVAIQATGKVTAEDYEGLIIPAVEYAIEAKKKIRMLYQLGPGLEGFTLQAMLDDAGLGMHHLSAFERIAVVTDESQIAAAVQMFAFAIPCPLRVFALAAFDDAKAWILE
jgi:hypothetical protein